jgi:hypothetical protein
MSHWCKDNLEAIVFAEWVVREGWSEEDVFLRLRDIGAGVRLKAALAKANEQCEAVVLDAGLGVNHSHASPAPHRSSVHLAPEATFNRSRNTLHRTKSEALSLVAVSELTVWLRRREAGTCRRQASLVISI